VVRVAWASVALLIVLGLLASVATLFWTDRQVPESMPGTYMVIGWLGVGGSLVVGGLGLWARAPATLATALGILGAGAFAAAWMANMTPADGDPTIVLAFVGVVVAFAASLRRPVS
jgi:hypothetical protein